MIKRIVKKRRRGVMAMVAVAGMVPVTAMMSANLNTSQMVNDRRIVQDGADALATMHGAWTARALNVISMNNVTTAQLMTVAVGSEALIVASAELIAVATAASAYNIGHNAANCLPRQPNNPLMWIPEAAWLAYCEFHHALVNAPALNAIAEAGEILDYFKPGYGVDTATKALEAIDAMNHELLARHPLAMAEIGEDYARALGIDDLHFADPCNGDGLKNCATTNTNNGMALPLEEETPLLKFTDSPNLDNTYAMLYWVMEHGTTGVHTTFAARGFPENTGPLSYGGGNDRHVREHINRVTGIGDSLNAFQHFYTHKNSDLPRYPFVPNPPNQVGPRNTQDRQPGTGIIGRGNGSFFDFAAEIAGFWDNAAQIILDVVRLIPLSYDRHPRSAILPTSPQDTDGPNAFTLAFDVAHGTVATPTIRNNSLGLMAPVPMMWRLKDLNQITGVTKAETETMPDPFRILAFALREKSPRLSSAVLTSPVEAHTGYGQVGVYNPDGASLYSQNWQHRLMPATRMDNAREAGQNLNRQAHRSFDDLATALSSVTSTSSWRRVHAH